MNIPQFFFLGSYKLSTFGIFLVLGFLFALFVVWQEGRRDGFATDHIFDTFILSSTSAILFSRVAFGLQNRLVFEAIIFHVLSFWTEGTNIYGAVLGFLFALFVLTKRLRWSLYRILDIFTLAIAFGLSVVVLGYVALQRNFIFLFIFAFYLLFYAGCVQLRGVRFRSGFIFSFFMLFGSLPYIFLSSDHPDLLFYLMLVTIGVVNFVFRLYTDMAVINKKHSPTLLKKLRARLLKKNARLEKEQQLLLSEDPYLQEDRAVGNAEAMDEALLEDAKKEVIDLQSSAINTNLSYVKRALARMRLGKYGTCSVCGGVIEKARLDIYPEATTCVSCFEKEKAA